MELEPGTGDDVYLATLHAWLPRLFLSHDPDLVFYQAGIDVISYDRLGKVGRSMVGRSMLDRQSSSHTYS